MKLDQDLHIIVFDLMECHASTSKDRVKTSLLTVVQEKLVEFFDPDAEYPRSSLVHERDVLVLTLQVSLDDDDETDYDSPDVEYHINVKTGRYTEQEQ